MPTIPDPRRIKEEGSGVTAAGVAPSPATRYPLVKLVAERPELLIDVALL